MDVAIYNYYDDKSSLTYDDYRTKVGDMTSTWRTRSEWFILGALLISGLSLAQSRGASETPSLGQSHPIPSGVSKVGQPRFEVVSVKSNKSTDVGGRFEITRDEFRTTATSLLGLIKWAYDVNENQIVGAPRWASSLTFDVEAKIDGSLADLRELDPNELRPMVQTILTNYFKLESHTDRKSLPSYVLVISKGGSKLKEYVPPSDTEEKRAIRMRGRGQIVARGVPIDLLVHALADQLNRSVVDDTGLSGAYDFTLKWNPDAGTGPTLNDSAASERSGGLVSEPEGISIFTAVQEQLGLKLQRKSAPDDILVIDHVEKPSPN